MLKKMEQYFMIALLRKARTRQDCNVTSKDFYSMTSFLSKNGIIISGQINGNNGRSSKLWELAPKGQIIAMSLNTLDNFDRKYYEQYFGGI